MSTNILLEHEEQLHFPGSQVHVEVDVEHEQDIVDLVNVIIDCGILNLVGTGSWIERNSAFLYPKGKGKKKKREEAKLAHITLSSSAQLSHP